MRRVRTWEYLRGLLFREGQEWKWTELSRHYPEKDWAQFTVDQILDFLGSQAWELVALDKAYDASGLPGPAHVYIFKRITEAQSELSEQQANERAAAELDAKLNMTVADLLLSVRATNCLESDGISTVRELVMRPDEELLAIHHFGESTLKEVKTKLAEHGLYLGMRLPSLSY